MRKLTLSLAVLAALLPGRANTLGLGELELNSALNQELDAEIEVLSAAPEDAEQMLIKLASREAFARAGIDRPYLLQQLKFDVVTRGDQPYIRVFSKTPIKEPFLSFLLEIDWPEGHLLREYTLLLDPPVYSGGASASATAPAEMDGGSRPFSDPADVQTQPQPAQPQQAPSRPAASAYTAPQGVSTRTPDTLPTTPPASIRSDDTGRQVSYRPMNQYRQAGGDYRVQKNDTLWSVAKNMRPDNSISVEQMMLALVRKNPEAFIKENIHGIKRGYILRIPERNTITSIDRQAAIAQVREHTALWREYRAAMSGGAPASAMASDRSTTASGMEPESEEGKLSIVGAGGEKGSESATEGQDPGARELQRLRNELSMAQESLESERMEKENLQARLAELEQRVQRALEMDDSELARLQQDLAGTREAAEVPVDEAPMPDQQADETETMQPAEEMAEPSEMDEQGLSDEEMVAEMPEQGVEEEPVFVDEAEDEKVAVDESAGQQPAVEPAAPPAVKPATPPPAFARPEPQNFFQRMMNDPTMLAPVGGALIAVLALIALLLRRLRRGKSDEDEWVASEEPGNLSDTAAFEEAGREPDVGMGATEEVPGPDFGDTQIDAPESGGDDLGGNDLEDTVMTLANEEPATEAEEQKDDVLAEADVYLAYGIYQQAEELLNKAISEHPERDDYRMKLLETHFASKNSSSFASLAEDVHQRKGGDRAYWDRVVVMGRELCPDHNLFSSETAEALPGLDSEDLLPSKPETTDLELDAGGEDELSSDLDLGFDEDETSGDDSEATRILNEPLDLDAEAPQSESADTELDMSMDDELDLAADLENIASGIDEEEQPKSEEQAAHADVEEDLEFDLGELGTDMEDTASTESASDELDMDEDFSLDFDASDLGFETDEEEKQQPTAEEASGDELDAELDLGMDLDSESAAEPGEEAAADDMEMDLGDLDMDMGEETADLGAAEESESVELDLGEDIGGLDLSEEGPDLDMDVDLDIDGTEEEPALELDSGQAEGTESFDDDFDISELSEDVDEVTTKLDLARAYIDMGDNEGARSILEEVQQEGNQEQQAKAAELLQQAS